MTKSSRPSIHALGAMALGLCLAAGCSGAASEEFDDELGTTGNGGADGGGVGDGSDAGAPGDPADGGANGRLDAGSGTGDGGPGGREDAGTGTGDGDSGADAGGLDAGGLDAGDVDAGGLDAGDVDAGGLDAGNLDAGNLDAGNLDAGNLDAGNLDAGAGDAGAGDAGPGTEIVGDGGVVGCDFGSAGSVATPSDVNLFGEIVYFASGAALPAGDYRILYEDGCMKYASSQDWTIHAYPVEQSTFYAWYLVGESASDQRVRMPGTNGYLMSNGAFADFEACVAANRALPPRAFTHTGGRLGVYLADSPYADNVTGVDGRNPRWRLEKVGGCGPSPVE